MKDAAMFYTNRVLKDYKGKFVTVESRPDDVFQIQVNKMINNNLKIKKKYLKQFLSCKILGKDEDHVQWTKLLLGALNELINFIKKNHTTGLVWNVKVKYLITCSNELRTL